MSLVTSPATQIRWSRVGLDLLAACADGVMERFGVRHTLKVDNIRGVRAWWAKETLKWLDDVVVSKDINEVMKMTHRLMGRVLFLGVIFGVVAVMLQQGAFGQSTVTNSQTFSQSDSNRVAQPFEHLSEASLNAIVAAKAGKPRCVLSFVSNDSQERIFSVIEPVTVGQGVTRYIDGYCGGGARLSRDYAGEGSLVNVVFHWDHSPNTTVISFYGTNVVKADTWRTNMIRELEKKYGAGSVEAKQ